MTGPFYEVTVTEYEAGIQRVDPNDTQVFHTKEEAEAYAGAWEEGGTLDCYYRAEIRKFG